jgi:hypothetical protein
MIIATSIMNKNNLKFAEGFDLINIFFFCEYVFAHVVKENNAECQGVKTHQEVDLPDCMQCSSLQVTIRLNFA